MIEEDKKLKQEDIMESTDTLEEKEEALEEVENEEPPKNQKKPDIIDEKMEPGFDKDGNLQEISIVKEIPEKSGNKTGEYEVGYKKPPKEYQFTSENQPPPEKKSRKGTRDWSTDFNEAIDVIAKQTGKTKSEVRTELLVRGIGEARKGNFNFWKEIVERDYGKISQPIETDFDIIGAKDLASAIQDILHDKPKTKKSDKGDNTDVLQRQKGKSVSNN